MAALSPAVAPSREFFEQWEGMLHPMSFTYAGATLAILGCEVSLGEAAERAICLRWDDHREGAVLEVETPSLCCTYPLDFTGGKVTMGAPDVLELSEVGVSDGHRLELVRDAVDLLQARDALADPLAVTAKRFRELLADCRDGYAPASVASVSGLSAAALRKLIARAVADTTEDELSSQLSLPIDGTYARADAGDEEAVAPSAPVRLPARRTRWEIGRELCFLRIGVEMVARAEEELELDLALATVLDASDPAIVTVQVPLPEEVVVREGARLSVQRHGAHATAAWLHCDLIEEHLLIGRLAWVDPEEQDDPSAGFFARAQRSPHGYVAMQLGRVHDDLDGPVGGNSAALAAVMGVTAVAAPAADAGVPPEHLEPSQVVAWRHAVHPDNPVTLVQGPPGTGKTTVLEAVLRTLVAQGLRVLVAAPSNTAVDNVCRRVLDLPLLRTGRSRGAIDAAVAAHWSRDADVATRFLARTDEGTCIAGTHLGLLRDLYVRRLLEEHGAYDVILFDEAGMAPVADFMLCANLAKRVVLFGDHQQLPPFPLPRAVATRLTSSQGAIPRSLWAVLTKSALEWLHLHRGFSVDLLQDSFRCQNPRLIRFSSALFYDAQVRPSRGADYFKLSYAERQRTYPPATLKFLSTSELPPDVRHETISLSDHRPGIENSAEADLAVAEFYRMLGAHPADQVTVITPYRRQVRLIRRRLDRARVAELTGVPFDEETWERYRRRRVATVDSFQGAESDAVIISYVRSNARGAIGFTADTHRINVAHTRCRREMVVIGDIACLLSGGKSDIFARMHRGFERDGLIEHARVEQLETCPGVENEPKDLLDR